MNINFPYDSPSKVPASLRESLVELAVGRLGGVAWEDRGEVLVGICEEVMGLERAEFWGGVLSGWCKKEKTLDQKRVEEDERRGAGEDVDWGEFLAGEELAAGDDGKAAEAVRALAGVVCPELGEARWGWGKPRVVSLPKGWDVEFFAGAGSCGVDGGMHRGRVWDRVVKAEWRICAVGVRDGAGNLVRLLPECRLARVRVLKPSGKRGYEQRVAEFQEWMPLAGPKLRAKAKCKAGGEAFQLDLSKVGLRTVVWARMYMPQALGGMSAQKLGKVIGVTKQALGYHARKVEGAMAGQGTGDRRQETGDRSQESEF